MQTQNKIANTVRADFYKVNEISMYFPKEEKNEFYTLREFYVNLIKVIPPNVGIKLLTKLNEEAKHGLKRQFISEVKCGIEDIWLKDFMGFNKKKSVIKPTYNPSVCSCKFNKDENELFNTTVEAVLINELNKTVKHLPLIWDCGNLVTNGKIGFISDKLLKDNLSKTTLEITELITQELGIQPIFIENNKYDQVGQISGYMQFLNKDTVAISEYPDIKELGYDNAYLKLLVDKATEQGFEVVRLREIPCYEYTKCNFDDGKKNCTLGSKGTYINFLIVNQTAIIPSYSDLEDIWECNQYNKEVLSTYFEEVIQINCDELSKVGGLLNSICITE